jgi:hypothetical protein
VTLPVLRKWLESAEHLQKTGREIEASESSIRLTASEENGMCQESD